MHPFLVRMCTKKTRKQYSKEKDLKLRKEKTQQKGEVKEILRMVVKGD